MHLRRRRHALPELQYEDELSPPRPPGDFKVDVETGD
jgi:hypothetical protein